MRDVTFALLPLTQTTFVSSVPRAITPARKVSSVPN